MNPRERVLPAAPRGCCAGVDRAIVTVEKAVEQYCPPVCVRHEIVLQAGAKASYLVDSAFGIDEARLEGVTTVGVTSGASVSAVLVDEVLARPARRGYEDVEAVETTDEEITCSLPKELRRDLRAKAAADSTPTTSLRRK
ncbi:hypothetical protein CK936_16335 [Streptomyces albireticuli]|uniref:Uncharacterized protein n=1 Tax=Streptomyces albireticuli TaxID=1940 RepID=A0A2A2D8V4_9ACTN|nr:hypothetical protein CK936_16335 [Streptomyces albireticuli]